MKVIFGRTDEHKRGLCEWIASRVPHAPNISADNGFAFGVVTDGGEMAAGVVFNEYYPQYGTIQVHIAAENPLWCRGNVIRDILGYPFITLGVYKVWGATPDGMEHVLTVNKKMGFSKEATLAHHYGKKKHAVITRLLKPDYFKLYWPQEKQAAA